jgi:tryptophanyl-tRNA synthetase
MAADILLFGAHKVPVGRDQVQHIEMARDFGARFNHLYGQAYFTLPEAAIEESVATLPGLDGRKMSKSYDNTIALFADATTLKKQIMGLLTDSKAPGAPKDTEDSALFQLYQAFATPEQTATMRKAFAEGIAWGDAKQQLFAVIDAEIAPMRERYNALMANPARIEAILQAGAAKARAIATPLLQDLRHAVGLRDLGSALPAQSNASNQKPALPVFKQYREKDGYFHFKLVAADGHELLVSIGHASPHEAGQMVARLKQEGGAALRHVAGAGLYLGEMQVGRLAADAALEQVIEALAAFAEEGV